MAYMHFSWSDSFQAAFSSCLPCLKTDVPSDTEDNGEAPGRSAHRHALLASGIIPPSRARPDELEGLLADASDDAETLSLHSNIGSDRRRKGKGSRKKWRRGAPKQIRVFGYDLFGRPPAIQLPESDNEDAGEGRSERSRTISTDTLDSDAAPLDVAAIEEMSAARHTEAVAREEEERRAKEERRRRRREKRELKRAAMARALEQQTNADEEFEGFQVSDHLYYSFHPSHLNVCATGKRPTIRYRRALLPQPWLRLRVDVRLGLARLRPLRTRPALTALRRRRRTR